MRLHGIEVEKNPVHACACMPHGGYNLEYARLHGADGTLPTLQPRSFGNKQDVKSPLFPQSSYTDQIPMVLCKIQNLCTCRHRKHCSNNATRGAHENGDLA